MSDREMASWDALRRLAVLLEVGERRDQTIPELVELRALSEVMAPKLEGYADQVVEILRTRGHESTVRVVPKAEMAGK